MARILNYTITEHENILGFLKSQGYSHTVITHLKKTDNGIRLNGRWAYVNDTLVPGDALTISITEISKKASAGIAPVPLPFEILYEDEDLLIVNKSAGMPIHPSKGNPSSTLANALFYYFEQKNEPFTFRCINRLDRDTSGLVIVARHILSASLLSSMITERAIRREYLAICEGLTPEAGTITAPIARACQGSMERCVDNTYGEYACTHYKRLRYENEHSLLLLHLETGRTHQIRVHLKHIGHPIPGDFLYHPVYTDISRQALHSYSLTFIHPISKKPLHFTAPLPSDMERLLLKP